MNEGADYRDRLIKWFVSGDTGKSSKAIVAYMTGNKVEGDGVYDHPKDEEGFGQCHRLLEAVPEYRGQMGGMAFLSREWAALIGVWHDLTERYIQGQDCDGMIDEALKRTRRSGFLGGLKEPVKKLINRRASC